MAKIDQDIIIVEGKIPENKLTQTLFTMKQYWRAVGMGRSFQYDYKEPTVYLYGKNKTSPKSELHHTPKLLIDGLKRLTTHKPLRRLDMNNKKSKLTTT